MMNKIFIALVLVVGLSGNVFSKTLETDIDGLVIKRLICVGGNYSGTIVNRSYAFVKNLTVTFKPIDKDGDPLGSCSFFKSLQPSSGDKFYANGCNCTFDSDVKISTARW